MTDLDETNASAPSGIGTAVREEDEGFERRAAHYRGLLDVWRERTSEVAQGGGPKRIEREHRRGKMTARERIAQLLDDADDFTELGRFAGYGMYEDEGGCPSAGTVMGLG
ncbi:MAG: acyl-CoA carboxylase subunit beta, partial [Rhodothermales bacterium]